MKAGVSGFWETLLFGYYKIHSGNTDYNWCDIETIIKDTLLTIAGNNKGIAFNALENVKRNEDPNDVIKAINDPIEKFLYQECMRFYYSFDRRKLFSDIEAYSLLIDKILQELHTFEKRFCEYIYDQLNEKEINDSYIVNAINLLKILTGFTNKQYKRIDDIIERQEEKYWEQLSPTMRRSASREKCVLSQEFTNLHSTISY